MCIETNTYSENLFAIVSRGKLFFYSSLGIEVIMWFSIWCWEVMCDRGNRSPCIDTYAFAFFLQSTMGGR